MSSFRLPCVNTAIMTFVPVVRVLPAILVMFFIPVPNPGSISVRFKSLHEEHDPLYSTVVLMKAPL